MGKTRSLTPAQCREFRTLREAGASFAELGKAFGVAPMTAKRGVIIAGGTVTDSLDSRTRAEKCIINSGRKRSVDAYLTRDGYRRVLIDADDPFFEMARPKQGADPAKTRCILEHRLVLARSIGRPMLTHETVHHKNGDPSDNRPENLELRVGRHGNGATEAHCPTCYCFQH